MSRPEDDNTTVICIGGEGGEAMRVATQACANPEIVEAFRDAL